MPLPLGHAAIGLAAYELSTDDRPSPSRLKHIIFLSILANLPDIDVIVGLLVESNGNVFHRGPTHGVVFALIAGFLASKAWQFSSHIPRMKFGVCFLIILSHILADFFITRSPVSFFWPFEVSWSSGYCGWGDVLTSIFFQGFQNVGIILGSAISIILVRWVKRFKSGILTSPIKKA